MEGPLFSFLAIMYYTFLMVIFYCYFKIYKLIFYESKDILWWSLFLIINVGMFGVNYFSLIQFSEIENKGFEDFLGVSIGISLLMWLGAHYLKDRKSKSDFYWKSDNRFKTISEIKTDKITSYPNIRIYDDRIEDESKKIIFDSSDFTVINLAFDTSNDFIESICVGNKLKFRKQLFVISHVEINFFERFNNNTSAQVRQGADTPFHIYIVIGVHHFNDDNNETRSNKNEEE